MKIAVAQLGARMHYAVPRIFHEAGILERLFTDAYIGNKPFVERCLRLLPSALIPRTVSRYLGRRDSALPSEKVKSFDWLTFTAERAVRSAKRAEAYEFANVEFNQRFGAAVVRSGFGEADTVWAYTSSALEIFVAAKARGLRIIHEQAMAPRRVYRELLVKECDQWPGWEPKVDLEWTHKLRGEREEREWEFADLIICGSQFVVDGIAECGGPVEKCRVVPYGVDLGRFRRKEPRRRAPGDRLRVLFVGEVGLRKGAPYLLEALRSLGTDRVEARCAGKISIAANKVEPYRDIVTFLGSVPRSRMLEHFAWADVFVLPSICEGSATAIYEAVALGLPVISTPNAGALPSDAVTIVPAGDIQALADALEWHFAQPTALTPISDAERANYGIAAYGSRLLATLCALNSTPPPAADFQSLPTTRFLS